MKYYEETGYNIDDTRDWLMGHPIKGRDQSFDGSVSVIYFKTCVIVVAPSGLTELREV